MRLSDLVTASHALTNDPEILGITADSREVKPGYLFAALPGVSVDGATFIPQAIESGAAAILAHTEHEAEYKGSAQDIETIFSDNPRHDLAMMASKYYPNQPENIVAVTGSNGKTSVTHFCRQLWQCLDYTSASLGTIGIEAPGFEQAGSMTTPDPVTLHSELQEMEACGISHVAMEASSHGLDQYRLDGINLKAAAFTNLSRDHLDYHHTMDNYLAAKARLFTEVLSKKGVAILNADIPEFEHLKSACESRNIKVIDYGYDAHEIQITERTIKPAGQFLKLRVLGELFEIDLPLVGEFQTYNALCALGLVIGSHHGTQLRPYEAVTYLENLQTVRGRMEYIGSSASGGHIYVDYAHTPDGLENVLKALRVHTDQKLCVVFGCGGDRDRGKRPQMGKIAHDLTDICIVTDDNPRTENADNIRSDIMSACPDALNIGDRKHAIQKAIEQLENGDILVVAGKGHETGQTIGDTVHPFDDAKVIRSILNIKKTA